MRHPGPVFGPIAQLDDSPRSWSGFLSKASRGSGKASEWLIQTGLAVAERLGGRRLIEEADETACDKALRRALPGTPPFTGVRNC
jgi:hypothetical protein